MGLLLTACAVGLGSAAGFFLVPAGVVGAVHLAGFTSAGVAAGSTASVMMSSAAVANGGAVAAGSAVAVLQSVGATAALPAVVTAAGTAVSGGLGYVVALLI